VACSALAAVRFVEAHPERVTKLHENTRHFRGALVSAGLKPLEGETPIVPIIIGETADAIRMSEMLLDEGIFVTGFGFPVVPHGTARLRCQVSAGHSIADLDFAVESIAKVARRVGILK
jgi:glycine C-acetyltransferase